MHLIYPVCFDEKDDFNRLNHFPGEMTFQTFLLDKDNKVVAIGNPVHNPKLKELYLKILTGGKAEKVEIPMTEVSMDVASIDFGSFPHGEAGTQVHTDQYGAACAGDIRCCHFLWVY